MATGAYYLCLPTTGGKFQLKGKTNFNRQCILFLIKFIRHKLQQRTLENVTYNLSVFVAILRLATRSAHKSAEQQLSKTRLATCRLYTGQRLSSRLPRRCSPGLKI